MVLACQVSLHIGMYLLFLGLDSDHDEIDKACHMLGMRDFLVYSVSPCTRVSKIMDSGSKYKLDLSSNSTCEIMISLIYVSTDYH